MYDKHQWIASDTHEAQHPRPAVRERKGAAIRILNACHYTLNSQLGRFSAAEVSPPAVKSVHRARTAGEWGGNA